MGGHLEHVDTLLAFPVRSPEGAALEIRVNFGMFAGREATSAEIQDLGAALLPEIGQVEIAAENRFEFGPHSTGDVHQVRIEVPASALAVDDFLIGELAGRLLAIAERWARECIAARPVGLTEL